MLELNHLENFKDMKGAILKITNKTQCYYVERIDKKYIVWQNTDKVENLDTQGKKLKYKNTYFDVLTGDCIFECELISIDGKYINKDPNTKIISLSKLLNIDGNKEIDLDEEDIIKLVNYKQESKKEKGRVF